jgi:hypothetical protein
MQPDTNRLIQRDIAKWRADLDEARSKVVAAVDGLDDGQIRLIAEGLLYYGFQRPDGTRRQAAIRR